MKPTDRLKAARKLEKAINDYLYWDVDYAFEHKLKALSAAVAEAMIEGETKWQPSEETLRDMEPAK